MQYLGSVVAFQAMVSIATIGLYVSYELPILFRITIGHKNFDPGPFHLGKYSRFIGLVAVLWVCTVTVLFCLPTAYPITSQTLNYTPVLVGGVFLLALGSWVAYARFWFVGPVSIIHSDDKL
jgi:amino acid transporter